jgi:hypothetical protein
MRKSGFINSALFEVWPKQVLFADIEDTRSKITPMTKRMVRLPRRGTSDMDDARTPAAATWSRRRDEMSATMAIN